MTPMHAKRVCDLIRFFHAETNADDPLMVVMPDGTMRPLGEIRIGVDKKGRQVIVLEALPTETK